MEVKSVLGFGAFPLRGRELREGKDSEDLESYRTDRQTSAVNLRSGR